MKLTTVTVRYGRTHNLGNYSNTRPEIELTGELAPGEDVETVKDTLFAAARSIVEEEIDRDLEAQGDAPHFSREPRFRLVVNQRGSPSLLALVPAGVDLPAGFVSVTPDLRLHATVVEAQRRLMKSETLAYVDCRDGDLSSLTLPTARPEPDEVPF